MYVCVYAFDCVCVCMFVSARASCVCVCARARAYVCVSAFVCVRICVGLRSEHVRQWLGGGGQGGGGVQAWVSMTCVCTRIHYCPVTRAARVQRSHTKSSVTVPHPPSFILVVEGGRVWRGGSVIILRDTSHLDLI